MNQLQARLSRVNQERLDLENIFQQSARLGSRTPQARRQGMQKTVTEPGAGGVRRMRPTSGERERHSSPRRPFQARVGPSGTSRPSPTRTQEGSFDPREAHDSLRQRMAGIGARERPASIQRPMQPEPKVKVEPVEEAEGEVVAE